MFLKINNFIVFWIMSDWQTIAIWLIEKTVDKQSKILAK